MKKAKFIEATEIVKPGRQADMYVGVELANNAEIVSILGVDLDKVDDIDIFDLEKKEYKFKVISDKERVHHLFSVATKRQTSDTINAEVALMNSRRTLKFCQNKVKEYFGKVAEVTGSEL